MSKRRSPRNSKRRDMRGVGDANAPGDRLGGGSLGRRPTSASVMICNRLAHSFESALSSDAKTNRAARLLRPVIWAWVVTVVGIVAIVALVAISVPRPLLLVLGVTAAVGALAALVQRWRQRPIEVPHPRIPS